MPRRKPCRFDSGLAHQHVFCNRIADSTRTQRANTGRLRHQFIRSRQFRTACPDPILVGKKSGCRLAQLPAVVESLQRGCRKFRALERQPVYAGSRPQNVTLVTIMHMNFLLHFITMRPVSAKLYSLIRDA
jgi:hypothetical protein